MKLPISSAIGLACLLLASCQPQTVYVPVPGPTKTVPGPTRVVYKPAPTPKPPAESAETFRAVEKPTTYSN